MTDEDILGEITQRRHLESIVSRARRLTEQLGELQLEHGHEVHFRPTAMGVDMVGLLPERPFAVRPAIKSLGKFVERFDEEFRRYCVEVPKGRSNVEKRLQAYLIRGAYQNQRRLLPLEDAKKGANPTTKLLFLTDDITVPFMGKRFACDLLALDESNGAEPVVIEVGKTRGNAVNVQRVRDYAAIVERQRTAFGQLYTALLGRLIELGPRCQRLILWPTGDPADGAEARLAEQGIRLAEFEERESGFEIRVGKAI